MNLAEASPWFSRRLEHPSRRPLQIEITTWPPQLMQGKERYPTYQHVYPVATARWLYYHVDVAQNNCYHLIKYQYVFDHESVLSNIEYGSLYVVSNFGVEHYFLKLWGKQTELQVETQTQDKFSSYNNQEALPNLTNARIFSKRTYIYIINT